MARSKHIPIYLKGFPSLLRWLRQSSTTLLLHWFTLLCWYALPPIVASIDCRLGLNYMCHLNKNILYVYNIALTFIYNSWHNVRPPRNCLRIHSNPRGTKTQLASFSKNCLQIQRRPKGTGTINTYLLYYFADFFNNECRLIEDKTMLMTIIQRHWLFESMVLLS